MSAIHAKAIFQASVRAVLPTTLISGHVRLEGSMLTVGGQQFNLDTPRKLVVIGAGKASALMAAELEKILGDQITRGFIVTKYEHGLPLKKIVCHEAAHPVPDENSLNGSRDLLHCLEGLSEHDIVFCLISGGASVLLTDLPPEASLKDLQQLSQEFLSCGATIREINVVRKHLSLIKGGQLLRYIKPATCISLILSDVIGDPLDIIASGPTAPDPSTFADAWGVIRKYGLESKISGSIKGWLQTGLAGMFRDTPKPGSHLFDNVFNYVIGSNAVALNAAADAAKELGYTTEIITDRLSGEAKVKATEFVQICLQYKGPKPACLLMGGETTVTVKGKGLGGRNQEFVLAALAAMKEVADVRSLPVILSAGTDGTDGPTDATGAYVDAEVLQKSIELKLDPDKFLAENDSYHFFQQTGSLIITGPTQTNVMDVVVGLIY